MKTQHLLTAASLAALAWTATSSVMAQNPPPKTREQVRKELMEAIRTGNIPCNDDSARLMREIFPSRYPQPPAVELKSREQVKEELAEAIRKGSVQCNNESGTFTAREVNPSSYPAVPANPGKSREAVKEELREAIRTDTLPKNSE